MNTHQFVKSLQGSFSITEENIENIMSGMLEGEHWAIHIEGQPHWSKKPLGVYQDEWVTNLLLHGESLRLTDKRNNNSLCSMTLEDLFDGIILSLKEANSSMFHNITTKTADGIIQYSLFKKIIY